MARDRQTTRRQGSSRLVCSLHLRLQMRSEPAARHGVQWLVLWSVAIPVTLSLHAAHALRRLALDARESWSRRSSLRLLTGLLLLCALPAAAAVHHVYFDDRALPDFESFLRFEPPTTGRVYDAQG